MLDVIEVETFGGDTGCNHNIFGARLEGLDGILALFLGYKKLINECMWVEVEQTHISTRE